MFVPKSSWEHPDSYLSQDIKSEMDKVDVLLNKIHITWEILNLSDLELQALINLNNRGGVALKKIRQRQCNSDIR